MAVEENWKVEWLKIIDRRSLLSSEAKCWVDLSYGCSFAQVDSKKWDEEKDYYQGFSDQEVNRWQKQQIAAPKHLFSKFTTMSYTIVKKDLHFKIPQYFYFSPKISKAY